MSQVDKKSFHLEMLRRFARLSRSFTTTPLVRSTPPSKVELQESIPGFRKPGVVATDYEVAAGLERYELLKTLKGEDPWTDLHPIEIKEKGTVKNPILVTGVDSERYIGCTGFKN
jgi:cytochrome c oxidase subunit 5b